MKTFHSWNLQTGTLANSDEQYGTRAHNAAFNLGLHFRTILSDTNTSFYRNFGRQPLKMQNGLLHTYCINMYGIIHQNEMGLNLMSFLNDHFLITLIINIRSAYVIMVHIEFVCMSSQGSDETAREAWSCLNLGCSLMHWVPNSNMLSQLSILYKIWSLFRM